MAFAPGVGLIPSALRLWPAVPEKRRRFRLTSKIPLAPPSTGASLQIHFKTAKMAELPSGFDVRVHTMQSFAEHAAWNGPYRWDRYNWARLRAQIDKTDGLIQRLIDEKGRVPSSEVDNFIGKSLDHYINQVYRSIKCLRDGCLDGHRLEAADSILPLLDAVFALHDGRLRPYYKYLRWELTEFPLERLPWSADEFLVID